MQIRRVSIFNFRGVQTATIDLPDHVVLVGDNNSCKSTILEALDLTLGPDRISRPDPIDEHDFYAGDYVDSEGKPILIEFEVTIVGLSAEQERHFSDHLEWWNEESKALLGAGQAQQVDQAPVTAALRVSFEGRYDPEDDDFKASTYFTSSKIENGNVTPFKKADKRICGFLYLRALRTGSRALSIERGSLLDIILQLEEVRPQMWESILGQIRQVSVADDPALGISGILESLQTKVQSFVTSEWADTPMLRVTDQTRESLRKQLTLFIETGATRLSGESHSAPYYHQGTGTINALVLALLSIIADLKKSVIFAMEEPETAIPPHAQKRIISSIRQSSSQALFTSHSPYVLEEFSPEQIVVLGRSNGALWGIPATLPPKVKPKAYKVDMKRRTCEALLARRVLVVEGATESHAIPAAARTLSKLNPSLYSSLEALGIAVVDAETDSQVAPMSAYFKNLGKTVFAAFDEQEMVQLAEIQKACDHPYQSPESSFEKLILNHADAHALRRFADELELQGDWPSHFAEFLPSKMANELDLRDALRRYFEWQKALGSVALFLEGCQEAEMPEFIRKMVASITSIVKPVPSTAAAEEAAPPEEIWAEAPHAIAAPATPKPIGPQSENDVTSS